MHGEGEARYPNGDVYRGGFENGRLHGPGQMTYASGAECTGYWVDGRCERPVEVPAKAPARKAN